MRIHPPSRSRHQKRRQLYQAMVISIKSRGRENERTVIPQPRDTRVQSTTSPNLNIFLLYSNCLLRATKPYCEPCTSDTGFCFKTQCCTTRDQRRDAIEHVGCDNTISRRAARIYHGVATSKHHRIFRLLGERWHGVGVHRRKDTSVRGHSPEINTNSSTEDSITSSSIHSPTFIRAKSRRRLTAKYTSDTFLGYHQAS